MDIKDEAESPRETYEQQALAKLRSDDNSAFEKALVFAVLSVGQAIVEGAEIIAEVFEAATDDEEDDDDE